MGGYICCHICSASMGKLTDKQEAIQRSHNTPFGHPFDSFAPTNREHRVPGNCSAVTISIQFAVSNREYICTECGPLRGLSYASNFIVAQLGQRRYSGVMTLQQHILDLKNQYGSYRKLAIALGMDHVYLCRLANTEEYNPTDATLAKLGLRRVVTYERVPGDE